MSNLGMYQTMTTIAKKVGGPFNLGALLVGGGIMIGMNIGIKIGKRSDEIKVEVEGKTFAVTSSGTDEQGLTFNVGDEYTVLESDGNAILIEKIGDSNNPYFVSAKFLRSISDFPKN